MKFFISVLFLASLFAETPETKNVCPTLMATYPVAIQATELPVAKQARFEIRTCGSGVQREFQLLAYEGMKAKPTLVVNTQASYFDLQIQTQNVLLVQAATGVSVSTVYVMAFHKGKPVLVGQASTDGGVSYREEHSDKGDFVIVSVPPRLYPDETGKFPNVPPRKFRIRTDE